MKKGIKNSTTSYITKEGLDLLKKEYEERTTVARNEIATKIDEARRFGDLSENNAYSSAMEEKNFNEARIEELEGLIHNSVVVKDSVRGIVSLGSLVHLKNGKGVVKYKIVGAEESDPEKSWISDKSPLGKSLIGKKEGDVVKVHIPSGNVEFVIEKVE